MLREVRLYGHLGRRFGRVHRFDVASPAEAIAALMANFGDFAAAVLAHNLPGYRVLAGDRALDRSELRLSAGGGPIRIVPVVAGAKRGGIGQVIIGAALIAAGAALNVYYPGNPVSSYLINGGVAMALGGVVSLLVPQPPGPKERPENQPSYFFDGAVNTTAQGQCVPVLFGRLVVGGAVISSGIDAEEIAGPAAPDPETPPPRPAEEPYYDWVAAGIIEPGGGG